MYIMFRLYAGENIAPQPLFVGEHATLDKSGSTMTGGHHQTDLYKPFIHDLIQKQHALFVSDRQNYLLSKAISRLNRPNRNHCKQSSKDHCLVSTTGHSSTATTWLSTTFSLLPLTVKFGAKVNILLSRASPLRHRLS